MTTMTTQKSYTVSKTSFSGSKAVVTDTATKVPVFGLEFSYLFTNDARSKPSKPAVTIYGPSIKSQSQQSVLGTADLSFKGLSYPIRLGFVDQDPFSDEHSNAGGRADSITYQEVARNKSFNGSAWAIHVDLGRGIGPSVFEWKTTHAIEGANALKRKDWLHLKMVEKESGKVVARFVHHALVGKKRGVFEFEEFDGGQDWDRVVVLSGTAVLEYLRKISGWSW